MEKSKCWECKKRIAKYQCFCGFELCKKCFEEYEGCPADEQIEHDVQEIN